MAWRAVPAKGYFVELSETQPGEYRHIFCGQHSIRDAWCPNCDKPLLRFLTLDLADPQLELNGSEERLPLMNCWTCGIAQADFYYQLRADNGISVLSCGRGEHTSDFPYNHYPEHFPQRHVQLVPMPTCIQQGLVRLNAGKVSSTYSDAVGMPELDTDTVGRVGNAPPMDHPDSESDGLTIPKHQVGGQPYLLDTYWRMRCPKCGNRMPFLASIGDYSGTTKGFADNSFVQLLYHYCRECRCVGCYQQTD